MRLRGSLVRAAERGGVLHDINGVGRRAADDPPSFRQQYVRALGMNGEVDVFMLVPGGYELNVADVPGATVSLEVIAGAGP